MTDHDSIPVHDRELVTNLFHTALVRAFVFQVSFALLACLILDGGIVRRAFAAASVGYWMIAVVLLFLRSERWGLLYLRQGVWVVFVLVLAIDSIWHEKVVDWVGG